MEKEFKHLANANLTVLMCEALELAPYGWVVDPDNLPFDGFTFKEVWLIRTEDTIAEARKRANGAEVGKRPYDKEARQENLAANRTKRWKNKEGQSDEG